MTSRTSEIAPVRRRNGARRSAAARGAVLCAACVALASSLGTFLPAAADEGPRAVVEETANAVLAVLNQKELPTEEKRAKIEDIVYAHVDFETLSRLVLGRNWKRFDQRQQADFEREFKRHLSVTYGNNINEYRNETVAILGDREEGRGDWTVHSKIVRAAGGQDFLVDYRLRRRDGEWKIIDVIVEGVSMVANFRSQFQSILSTGGPDHLLQLLHEKNARGESLKS
jgi:phospholipid transport system substrate-binding protein